MKIKLKALLAAIAMVLGFVSLTPTDIVRADGPFSSTYTYCGDYSHGYRRVCVDPTTSFGHAMLYVYGNPATPLTYTASSPVAFTGSGVKPGWVTTPSYGNIGLFGSGASQHLSIFGITTPPVALNNVCLNQYANPPYASCTYQMTVYQDAYSSYHGVAGASLAQVWSEVVFAINGGGNFQIAN